MALIGYPVDAATSKSFTGNISSSYANITDFQDPTVWSWFEVVASTPEKWIGFYFIVTIQGNGDGIGVIASGAAGAEQIIAVVPATLGANGIQQIFIPLEVAAGTRLSISGNRGMSGVQIVGVTEADYPSVAGASNYITGPYLLSNSVVPVGITVDPGATPNTKGAWTEVSVGSAGRNAENWLDGASVPGGLDFLGISLHKTLGSSTHGNTNWLMDVAYGPAGDEVIIGENIHFFVTTFRRAYINPIWFPWGKAADTRLAVRLQSDNGEAGAREITNVLLHGVTMT